jgi:hypothetical protein
MLIYEGCVADDTLKPSRGRFVQLCCHADPVCGSVPTFERLYQITSQRLLCLVGVGRRWRPQGCSNHSGAEPAYLAGISQEVEKTGLPWPWQSVTVNCLGPWRPLEVVGSELRLWGNCTKFLLLKGPR